jgi:hypothetical protein
MPPFRIDDIRLSFRVVKAIRGVMNKVAKYLSWIGFVAALATSAFAETRTISWNPVTTYTDGTPIEAGKTITYSAFWTTDPGLGSLHDIGTSLATTSTTFDPDVLGMPRGGTVYFTAKAVLNTGEDSVLSSAQSWVVPLASTTPTPPPPAPPPPTTPPEPPPTTPPSKAPPAAPTGGMIIKK